MEKVISKADARYYATQVGIALILLMQIETGSIPDKILGGIGITAWVILAVIGMWGKDQ